MLFVSGFEPSLRVQSRHLIVRTVVGRDVREARLSKVARPRLRRLVVFGTGGYTTWEALAWLDGIGASFLHLSRSGRTIAASGERGPDQPALRRAQALATDTEAGLAVVRYLLEAKVEGQLSILERHFPADRRAIGTVRAALESVRQCRSTKEALVWEARAATAYWGAWPALPTVFSRADVSKIPQHWRTAGNRHSPLSTSPRLATTPAQAILNYLYALAEFECRLALLAVGLDPGLGWAHRDAPYRDSAALDLLEPIRPAVDDFALGLLEEKTFSRREFVELATGQVRLSSGLAKRLADSTLGSLERAVGPIAEQAARLMASAASSPVRVPSRSTRGAAGRGRATLGRGIPRMSARPKRIAQACPECGVVLDRQDRAYCDDCLPKFEAERTGKLVRSARVVLSEMRASPEDPAQSEEARRKRAEKVRVMSLAARAWEREHGPVYDPDTYSREILPKIQGMSVRALAKLTGLSDYYLWQVRKGQRRLHPRFWDRVASRS